jgi:ribosome-associated toxin RatA of RatAB toxin-antitoxin module
MFRLVDDVESYPDFLPWCSDAVIEKREEDATVATVELHKGGISKRFTTRNTRTPSSAIDLDLVGGPFRRLSGGWRFQDLGEGGCKVSLELEFAFDNRLVDMMFGPFFEDTCNSLVDAFTRRAAEVYGSR